MIYETLPNSVRVTIRVYIYYFHLLSLWVLYCYVWSCTHLSSFCCLGYLIISQIQCQALFLLVACCLLLVACSWSQVHLTEAQRQLFTGAPGPTTYKVGDRPGIRLSRTSQSIRLFLPWSQIQLSGRIVFDRHLERPSGSGISACRLHLILSHS